MELDLGPGTVDGPGAAQQLEDRQVDPGERLNSSLDWGLTLCLGDLVFDLRSLGVSSGGLCLGDLVFDPDCCMNFQT